MRIFFDLKRVPVLTKDYEVEIRLRDSQNNTRIFELTVPVEEILPPSNSTIKKIIQKEKPKVEIVWKTKSLSAWIETIDPLGAMTLKFNSTLK
jgi:hypothetical protein